MCTHYAATAPEFFPHHAFLDKIWFLWQQKSPKHKNTFFEKSEKKLTGFPHTAKELIDSHNLPGLVKVTYSKYPDSKRIARDIAPEPDYIDGKYKNTVLLVTCFFKRNRPTFKPAKLSNFQFEEVAYYKLTNKPSRKKPLSQINPSSDQPSQSKNRY